MSKRKWTNMELYEPDIIRLREAGLTRQQIADELYLEKVQIKNWINRYNKRQSIMTEQTPLFIIYSKFNDGVYRAGIDLRIRRIRFQRQNNRGLTERQLSRRHPPAKSFF